MHGASAAGEAFLSRLAIDEPARGDTRALAVAVDEALARARQTWPTVAMSDTRFGEGLADRLTAPADVEALRQLHAGDLYLALACADGDLRAIAAFESTFFPDVRTTLARRGFSASSIDEALQVLRASLFVAGEQGPQRILDYSGRGTLRSWLRIVAARAALRLLRPTAREESLASSFEPEAPGDLELEYLKRRYGSVFQAAFAAALTELPVSERLLLKQRFTLQMTVADLGVLHGVHGSTVSRWVTDIRQRLVAATRAQMMKQLHADGPEVSSILRLIDSQIDLTLSTNGASGRRSAAAPA